VIQEHIHKIVDVMKRKPILIIPLVLILFLLLRTILLQKPDTELAYTVKQENLVDAVQVSGTYTTASQVQVASPTTGVISKLYVTNGDMVKKGDPLFHVESTATAAEQKAAYANYLAASAAVESDKATLYSLQSAMYSEWDEYQELATNSTYENDDGSPKTENRTLPEFTTRQNDWLAAEAKFKTQQKVIAKSQAALSSAKQLYDQTQNVTVTAPIGGTVANLLLQTGDQVAASFISPSTGNNTATPILVVTNFGNPYLSANVSQDYAVRINTGQNVKIVFDALKDEIFTGVVENIASVGVITQGVVSYATRIIPHKIPAKIKPNMTAIITIETLRKDNVIAVPNSAIITNDEKTYVLQAKSHRKIPVTLGIKGITQTEITNGLKEGMVIVANP
jgi:HlyD family secretion protein